MFTEFFNSALSPSTIFGAIFLGVLGNFVAVFLGWIYRRIRNNWGPKWIEEAKGSFQRHVDLANEVAANPEQELAIISEINRLRIKCIFVVYELPAFILAWLGLYFIIKMLGFASPAVGDVFTFGVFAITGLLFRSKKSPFLGARDLEWSLLRGRKQRANATRVESITPGSVAAA